MSPGLIELIVFFVAVTVALVMGRYYAYRHPWARKMDEKRQHDNEASPHDA